MKKASMGLIAAGLLLLVYGLLMDTSISSSYGGRVHNIGLMNDRLATLIAGGFVFLGGVVFFCLWKMKSSNDLANSCIDLTANIDSEAKLRTSSSVRNLARSFTSEKDSNVPLSVSKPPWEKSLLNKSCQIEVVTLLNAESIKNVVVEETKKIQTNFDPELLISARGKTVYAEVHVNKQPNDKWQIKVSYLEEGSKLIHATILMLVFFYAAATGKPLMATLVVIAIPCVWIVNIFFASKFTTQKVQRALKTIQERLEKAP